DRVRVQEERESLILVGILFRTRQQSYSRESCAIGNAGDTLVVIARRADNPRHRGPMVVGTQERERQQIGSREVVSDIEIILPWIWMCRVVPTKMGVAEQHAIVHTSNHIALAGRRFPCLWRTGVFARYCKDIQHIRAAD